MCSVVITYCVCQRPSWTPKTQPNGHQSVALWLSFWCSTLLTIKRVDPTSAAVNLITMIFLIGKVTGNCRRPSWTPKTQPNGQHFVAAWLSLWCSTRFNRKRGHPTSATVESRWWFDRFKLVTVICQRPSWIPKTKPNGQHFCRFVNFWSSTQITRKKLIRLARQLHQPRWWFDR